MPQAQYILTVKSINMAYLTARFIGALPFLCYQYSVPTGRVLEFHNVILPKNRDGIRAFPGHQE